MNIFASDRITPDKIKFPKKLDKIVWEVKTSQIAFTEICVKEQIEWVVIDTGAGFNALTLAKILTEIAIDKHQSLPMVMTIGPNEKMKKEIENYFNANKKWIDISRGK